MKVRGTHRVRTVTKDELERVNILFLYDPKRDGIAYQAQVKPLNTKLTLTTYSSIITLYEELRVVCNHFGISLTRIAAMFGLSNGYFSAVKSVAKGGSGYRTSIGVHDVTTMRLRVLREKVNDLIEVHNAEVALLFPEPEPEPEPVIPPVGEAHDYLGDVVVAMENQYTLLYDIRTELMSLNLKMAQLIEIWGMTPQVINNPQGLELHP